MTDTRGSSLIEYRYDAAGKCLDCGGLGGCHSLECAGNSSLSVGACDVMSQHGDVAAALCNRQEGAMTRELPEKLWRCDCGTEVLGVSFYTWSADPPDWFIEVYKMPGRYSWNWRWKTIWNLLLGREVVIDAVSLDKHKVEELIAFLQYSIAEAEAAAPNLTLTGVHTQTTRTDQASE